MRSLTWILATCAALVTGQGVSTSARCGPNFGLICTGSVFGSCCSVYSYCGSTDAYCSVAKGCQAGWGSCRGSSSSVRLSSTSSRRTSSTLHTSTRTASASPSSTQRVSSNARCGKEGSGQTCLSSGWGNCCSQWSYCGSNINYCGAGCQQGFGQCNTVSSSPRLSTLTVRSSTSIRSTSSSSARTSSSSLSFSTTNSASPTHSSSASPIIRDSTTSTSPNPNIQISSSTRFSSSLDAVSSIFSSNLPPGGASSSSSVEQQSSISHSVSSTTQSSSATSSPSSSESTLVFTSPSSSSTLIASSTIATSSLSTSSSASSSLFPDTTSSVSPAAPFDTSSPIESSTSTVEPTGTSTSSLAPISSQAASSTEPTSATTAIRSTTVSDPEILSTTFSINISSSTTTATPAISPTDSSSATSIQSTAVSDFASTSSFQGRVTTQTSSTKISSTTSSSDLSATSPTPSETSTFTTSFSTTWSSTLSASLSATSDPVCNPIPSPTCRIQDCATLTNAVASPSASYNSVPIFGDHGLLSTLPSVTNISVPIKDLTVEQDYVLTFYGGSNVLGSGSNSCCNLTAYMDNVAISRYCVGFYWWFNYRKSGPWADSSFENPRSPAVVYRPSIPNPALTFNVVCPPESDGVLVTSAWIYGVSLVPRCTCQEEDKFQSIQSQPLNAAFNGNFAEFNRAQENPVSGWISQENWSNQVIPVQYKGTALSDDKSNNGSVVLMGASAALYRPISNLVPSAPHNVSILWRDPTGVNSCTLVVKLDDTIIMELPRTRDFANLGTIIRNSTIVYPKATSGTLWIGSWCPRQLIYNVKGTAQYPSVRIDDVTFNVSSTRLGCSAI